MLGKVFRYMFLESHGSVDGYQEEGTSLLDDTLYLKDVEY